jgi:putative DNA modification/repair radical SAM protein
VYLKSLFMSDRIQEKLSILADAAKYDVSCSSSGSKRSNKNKGLGDATGMGICHSYTEDGRCVSLLKILLTNYCIFDCAYCVTRRSNDIKRAAFTVDEVVDLTINFYRRNYIEGLFLSSGIFKSADYTMERLVRVAKKLRKEHNFNGYIHLKSIPGASDELMHEAGLYADRVSVNIEMPTEQSLKQLAPEKNTQEIVKPMSYISKTIEQNIDERKSLIKAPLFAPAGQTTQMVIGATPETDRQIITVADKLYKDFKLKRVYYSGYIPIRDDSSLLPALQSTPPLIRENRLYQADWLMRFYGFEAREILDEANPSLDLEVDPKLAWALRNMHFFPVDVNTAPYEMILRIPGVGVKSAKKIFAARSFGQITMEHLKKFGVPLSRARYFLTCASKGFERKDYTETQIRARILKEGFSKYNLQQMQQQLVLF